MGLFIRAYLMKTASAAAGNTETDPNSKRARKPKQGAKAAKRLQSRREFSVGVTPFMLI